MRKIHTLPEHIVSQIAAGEVIERPAYAIKELLDNAIDAQADSIVIQIKDSGLSEITIIDNGEGMNGEDLAVSFLPHTTSKLRTEAELVGIRTLGFRGEALASIAAICTLTIKSRTKNAASGNSISNREDKIKPVGMPIGTMITIEHLFAHVPARKKFLKSSQTEFRHITDVVTNYALTYPSTHFLLIHNDKTILDLPKRRDVSERISALLGEDLALELIPLRTEESYLKLLGFVGTPQVASKNNQKQYIFVNKRIVSDKKVSLAVKEAYGTLLPATSTPVFVLYLTIPFQAVDVNVHPRKEQVSFVDERGVFDVVKLAVTQALTAHNLTFNLAKFRTEHSGKLGETSSFAGELLREAVLPWNKKTIGKPIKNPPVVQIHNLYLFTLTSEGAVFVDQHGAHERILYEEFLNAFSKEKQHKHSYTLSIPLQLSLSVSEAQTMEEYQDVFINVGFVVEHFQKNTYMVRQIPNVFRGRKINKILGDMLSDLAEQGRVADIDVVSSRMLAFLACRAAVQAGDSLSDKQAKELLASLAKTPNNMTCPHGRPTKVTIGIASLDRAFKRR